jgi:hypothetical protein
MIEHVQIVDEIFIDGAKFGERQLKGVRGVDYTK